MENVEDNNNQMDEETSSDKAVEKNKPLKIHIATMPLQKKQSLTQEVSDLVWKLWCLQKMKRIKRRIYQVLLFPKIKDGK